MDTHGYETHPSLTYRGSYGVGSSEWRAKETWLWRVRYKSWLRNETAGSWRAVIMGRGGLPRTYNMHTTHNDNDKRAVQLYR